MTTPRELVLEAEKRFESAGLTFGHGTATARDEAVFLVFRPLGLAFDCPEAALDAPVAPEAESRIRDLIDERIERRVPAAYLLGVMWFAGYEFEAAPVALVPRSPIAELILAGFEPWLGGRGILSALEIGTGSGCIACAVALECPKAHVDATDLSEAALALARRNVARHGLEDRVALIPADVWPPDSRRYDLIVSNPPYVPDHVVAALPAEYRHEPALGLKGGPDGMAVVDRILAGAAERLNPGGLLVLEVGEQSFEFESRYPDLDMAWVELVHGGEGVMVIEREALATRLA